jgi:hypothetical protein
MGLEAVEVFVKLTDPLAPFADVNDALHVTGLPPETVTESQKTQVVLMPLAV